MDGTPDATLVAELHEAGERALDRGVGPEGLALAMGEVFAAFAGAVIGAGGTMEGAVACQAFCDGAFAEARRRAAAQREAQLGEAA